MSLVEHSVPVARKASSFRSPVMRVAVPPSDVRVSADPLAGEWRRCLEEIAASWPGRWRAVCERLQVLAAVSVGALRLAGGRRGAQS